MRPLHMIELAAAAVSIPSAVAGVYVGALGALASPHTRNRAGGGRARAGSGTERARPREVGAGRVEALLPVIAIVVPAHDEEAGLHATAASLLATDYPADRRIVLVVADNCTDATAEVARRAGAHVMERNDPDRRGKGYALALAFDHLLRDTAPVVDAIAVVDADTLVSPNLLREMAAAFGAGASVVQADYGVRNAGASWRTRLLVIALSSFHGVRSLGRERLRVSCGLRGNGMGFTTDVLRAVPQRATGLVEDVEHGVELGLAGYRVWYLREAHVWGEMPATAAASRSQRDRWERGRRQLVRRWAPPLLRRAWRDRIAADLLADLIVPPLSQIVLALTAAVGLGAVVVAMGGSAFAIAAGACGLAGVGVYVARGWQLSGTGTQGLLDLAKAPAYMTWKLAVDAVGLFHRRRSDVTWIRTTRDSTSLTEGAA